ncbi:hypothetical protein SAMN05428970_0492 [Agromyces sp. CF514]|nr:hypothetical protein SAMN05428970_0492 [Agromyces sp. CF514]
MTRRSAFRNPAVIALIALLVGSVLLLQWVSRAQADGYQAISSFQQSVTVGEQTAVQVEVNAMYAWINAAGMAATVLGGFAAASALALVFAWCFWPRAAKAAGQSSDGTRMMSAAGSTVNRADTTVPNSSPSISNSSAPSPISMSTERPRE